MTDVFSEVIRISITASFVSLVVIIARLLLKRMPRWITCLLWAVVALRLIFPVMPQSAFSFVPTFDYEDNSVSVNETILQGEASYHSADSDKLNYEQSESADSPNTQNTLNHRIPILSVGSVMWGVGTILMLGYSIYSYVSVKMRFRDAVIYKENILRSEKVSSPFVMGFLRPKIYIPFNLDSKTRKQVILHEHAHIKRLDYIWKPLGFTLLCLHWFNPFMWISYILFCRDIEVACDEKVISNYGLKMKKAYARALLECRNPSKGFAAAPIAFGEIGVRVRIKKTIKYRKPATAFVVLGVVGILMLSLCLMTDPVSASNRNAAANQTLVQDAVKETDSIEAEDIAQTEPSDVMDTEPFTEPSTVPMETTVPQNTESDAKEDYSEEYYYEDESYDYDPDLDFEFTERSFPDNHFVLPPGTYEPIDSFSNSSNAFKYFGDGTFNPYTPDLSAFDNKSSNIVVGAPIVIWDY